MEMEAVGVLDEPAALANRVAAAHGCGGRGCGREGERTITCEQGRENGDQQYWQRPPSGPGTGGCRGRQSSGVEIAWRSQVHRSEARLDVGHDSISSRVNSARSRSNARRMSMLVPATETPSVAPTVCRSRSAP